MRPVRILVFVQTALALVFTYSDSSRDPAPAFLSCHPVARAPRKLTFSRVDADHGTQVIKLVAYATQIPAVQWIPTCAGMTIKKNLKIKELKNLSSRGPGPAKTSVFVGGCRHRDPGNLCRRECDTTFTTNHFNI